MESDRDAEWALLQSLTTADVLPIPAARWYVQDPSWFGTKALFLDHLPSTTLQAQLETTTVPRAAERLCDLMADVASVTPEQVGIAGPASWDAYIDAKLAAWRAVADDHVEALPVTRYLVAWMDTHRPPPAPFRLVHGDLQAANVLVTPDDTWHLIDWEFARIGDPREDLGYYNAYSGAVPAQPARRRPRRLPGPVPGPHRSRRGHPQSGDVRLVHDPVDAGRGEGSLRRSRRHGPGRAQRHAGRLQLDPGHPR